MKILGSFLFLSLFTVTFCYHYSNLTYQAHGFNDLDYFLQQLVKGTNFFKVDVSEASSISCEQHSSWNYENECEYFDYFDICCLGFRGDTGSEPVFVEPFNTTYDLLRLLNSTKYDFIWRKENQLIEYNFTKYIAINFQFGHSLSKMTKYFIYNLLKTIEVRGLNIQIITGSNDFITDYEDKCATGPCDYMEQYIADSNVMFQSSGPNETDKRVTNFNMDYTGIENYCQDGFPEWPDRYGLPYFFWEPSSEDTIKYVLNTFKNESCKKTELHSKISDIKITSNLEPEMMEIYSKPFNNTEDIVKILLENGLEPHIEYDEKSNTIFFSKVLNENETLFQIFSINQNQSHLQNQSLVILFESKMGFHSAKFEKKEKFLVFYSDNLRFLYFIYYNGDFVLSFIDVLENDNDLLGSTLLVKQQEPFICSLFFKNETLTLSVFDVFNNETIVVKSIDMPYNFSSESILNADVTSYFDNDNEFKIVVIYSKNVLPQNSTGLFSIMLDLSDTFEIYNTISSQVPFAFGDYPSAKLVQLPGGELMIFEVHSDGLCQCGMMMNNNEFGKCHFADYENHYALLNIQHLMNYIWGTFEDFKNRVTYGEVINGCDKSIMHAKFNNGRKPKAGIFSFGNRTQALITNEYVSYDDLPLVTRLLCGGNQMNPEVTVNGERNVVVQSFSLTDGKVFSQLKS